MTGMNRLSPLIVRRVEPFPRRPGAAWSRRRARAWAPADFAPAAIVGSAAAAPLREPTATVVATPAQWLEDLRLFATGWIGGLIFFGTLLG